MAHRKASLISEPSAPASRVRGRKCPAGVQIESPSSHLKYRARQNNLVPAHLPKNKNKKSSSLSGRSVACSPATTALILSLDRSGAGDCRTRLICEFRPVVHDRLTIWDTSLLISCPPEIQPLTSRAVYIRCIVKSRPSLGVSASLGRKARGVWGLLQRPRFGACLQRLEFAATWLARLPPPPHFPIHAEESRAKRPTVRNSMSAIKIALQQPPHPSCRRTLPTTVQQAKTFWAPGNSSPAGPKTIELVPVTRTPASARECRRHLVRRLLLPCGLTCSSLCTPESTSRLARRRRQTRRRPVRSFGRRLCRPMMHNAARRCLGTCPGDLPAWQAW